MSSRAGARRCATPITFSSQHTADLAGFRLDADHLAACADLCAMGSRGGRVALHDHLRARVSVEGAERRREHPLDAGQRRELLRLLGRDEPARHAVIVLQDGAPLEERDVLGPVEEEEVADRAEVDLPPRALRSGRTPRGCTRRA